MAASLAGASASDLLRSSTSSFSGVPLRTLGKGKLVLKRRDFTVAAKLKKYRKREYPWPANPDPNVTGGVLSHLCRFKPLTEKPKRITLDFEKPLLDLQKKITDVRKMANDTGLDFSDQILSLESKYQQALKDLYIRLTPIQRVHIARHPNRPTFFDHILNITEKFVEIHGDRAGYDDPATVTGIGTIDGKRYMFIGQQKGRNTKENIQRNFGMSTPHGYRKALRMMKYADHHGFPIVTFIDTPGAYADLESEEKGQGEAIAQNLRTMFGLKVPILSIVIGEGGSGGALAIGCANKLLMLENAVFYVASPEACAAILWKNSKAAPKAAEKLKITAPELCKLEVADGVIPEPLGGAHADPEWTSQQIKKAINETMAELTEMNTEDLLKHRMHKFRKIGGFGEGVPMDPSKKFSMKKRDLSITKMPDVELGVEIEKLKQQILDAKKSSPDPPKLDLEEMIKQLEREIDQEYSEAVKATGLTDRLLKLREEVSKANADNQVIDPLLKDFEQGLRAYPNYNRVQNMVKYLKELYELQDKEAVTLKQELKKQVDNVLSNPRTREKFEALKAEIESVNASSPSDLDDELKKKIVEFKKEIDLQLVNALESMNLEVIPNINIPDTEELKKIDSLVNSSDDIKSKIQQLKLEVLKAGETPDSESKNRIDILVQQIKQSLIEAIDSSGLKDQIVNPAEDSLTDSELRVKVGTNRSVS